MIQVGQKVDDFEFEMYHNQDISKAKFSSLAKKWLVLLFYQADFSFACPTELEDATDHYEEFKNSGAEIVSIGTDTAYVHKAWHDQSPAINKIKYPMVSDAAGKLWRYFGT